MSVRVAINGFGRIGRNVLRAIIEAGRSDIEVVAINDLAPVETNAHLLRFDSIHGRFPGEVIIKGDTIECGNGPIKVTAIKDPTQLPWKALGIDRGFMTTVHSYTNDQPSLDQVHKDLYRARAAALSMIPTSTGAAKAVGLVLPELNGKLDGVAIRVPTPNVSVVDFKFVASRKTDVKEINEAMKRASEQQLKGILGYTTARNVSIDFNNDPHAATFHMYQTK